MFIFLCQKTPDPHPSIHGRMIRKDDRYKVKEVSVDMWGGFQKVIKEVFPNALIVIDRFHVMKLVNKSGSPDIMGKKPIMPQQQNPSSEL